MRYRLTAALKWSLAKGDTFLVPSQFTRDELMSRSHLDPSRVRVAPNALDPALLAELGSRRRNRDDGRLRVLVVGNVLPRKNLIVVADAVGALRRSGLDVELRVVGSVSAPHQPLLEEMRQRAVRVEPTGYVSLGQLAQEYLDADVVAYPSLYEGFGIPVLEAMAARIPVIVSDRGSLPEVAGGAAQVASATDSDAWRAAIEQVVTNRRTASELVERGLSRVQAFNWAMAAGQALEAMRQAAGQGSR
jgi:glycosyltransferase involved in cell wall biosynthesis